MNLYDELYLVLRRVEKLSPEDKCALAWCRVDIRDLVEKHGDVATLALLMEAYDAAIKEREKQEMRNQAQ